MARISGMILGLGLLVVLSTFASPASAWDSDDDDDHRHKSNHRHKHHPHHHHHAPFGLPPIAPEPILIQPRYSERYDYPYIPEHRPIPQGQFPNDHYNPYRIDFGAPQYQPAPQYPQVPEYQPLPQYQQDPQVPLAPPPLPPEELFGETTSDAISGPSFASSQPEPAVTPDCQPGEFVTFETALYPHVRVEGLDEIPRHAVPQIIAVRSPDPFRFPGLAYVQVRVPPGPCRNLKVSDDGAKIEMKYGDFSVEVASAKGVVSVEYDD